MKSRTIARAAVVASLATVLALAACAPETEPKTWDPKPEPSQVQPETPTVEPAPAEPEAPPTEPQEPAVVTVGEAQAEQVCLDIHAQVEWTSLTPTGPVAIYERAMEPIWLVLIPGVNEYGNGYIQCEVHSDPNQQGPFVSEAAEDLVTYEFIQSWINGGEGM